MFIHIYILYSPVFIWGGFAKLAPHLLEKRENKHSIAFYRTYLHFYKVIRISNLMNCPWPKADTGVRRGYRKPSRGVRDFSEQNFFGKSEQNFIQKGTKLLCYIALDAREFFLTP